MHELIKQINYESRQFRLFMDNAGNGGIPKPRRVRAYEEAFSHLVKEHELFEEFKAAADEKALKAVKATLDEDFKLYTGGWGRVKKVVQESRQGRHERKEEKDFDY